MVDPRRILVIRRKAIGDVLVSMAVPRALKRRWPDAHLALVVDRFAAPVVEGSEWVDEIIVYDRKAHAQGSWVERGTAFQDWLTRLRSVRADLTIDLMGTPQTALWTRVSGASVRVGPDKRHRTWAYTHVVKRATESQFAGERFLDWVRRLDVDCGAWEPIPVSGAARVQEQVDAELAVFARPLVFVNPSASWSAKAWPAEHFGALAKGLAERTGGTVLVAWGPGEESLRDGVVEAAQGAARAMPATDLPTLAAWLGRGALLVTTDSGPKHVAVAQGTPTMTLFGSTDPQGWQPRDPRHAWLTNPVDCHPCNRLECNVEGHPCLDDLSPATVLEACVDLLTRTAEAR